MASADEKNVGPHRGQCHYQVVRSLPTYGLHRAPPHPSGDGRDIETIGE